MNGFIRGSAVLSKAGRDKNRFFAVIGLEGEYALIADGDLRKIENPKRKKLKHLQLTNTVFTAEELEANGRLRRAINKSFPEAPTKEV